ncbi:MAG: hypothetical protein FWE61_08200 [Micrococcales bacterium]|nr:hypothetical protein [Micrococcales bacterium]
MNKTVAAVAVGVVLAALVGCGSDGAGTEQTAGAKTSDPGPTATVTPTTFDDAASCLVGSWSAPSSSPGFAEIVTFDSEGHFVYTKTDKGAFGADDTVYIKTETIDGPYEIYRDMLSTVGTYNVSLERVSDGAKFGSEILASYSWDFPSWISHPEVMTTTITCDWQSLLLTTDTVGGVVGAVKTWEAVRD